MTLKSVFAPHLNHHVVLGGRKHSVADCPHLKLGNYLRASLPPPPVATSYRTKAGDALHKVYMNDQLGCCTVSAKCHIEGLVTANAGTPVLFTDAQVVAMYSAITGYKPGDPSTDRGSDMQTVLNWIVQNGFAGSPASKPLGWVSVDLTNKLEVQHGIFLFENADIGWDLPDAWINPFPSKDGDVWDVAGDPDPNNGHDTPIVDYDADGVWVDTWGLLVKVPWAALARYGARSAGGEGYILITHDMLAKGVDKAPNGIDWASLVADFDAMGGQLPVPVPPPAPPAPPPAPVPVTPAPTATMTLAECQLCAIDKLHKGPFFLTRTQAEKLVVDSLAMHWPKV